MGYNTQIKQLSDFYDAYGLEAGDDEEGDDELDDDDESDDDGSEGGDSSGESGNEMSVDGR